MNENPKDQAATDGGSVQRLVRHFCIRVGGWKFENWHFYQDKQKCDANTNGQKAKWMTWEKIF